MNPNRQGVQLVSEPRRAAYAAITSDVSMGFTLRWDSSASPSYFKSIAFDSEGLISFSFPIANPVRVVIEQFFPANALLFCASKSGPPKPFRDFSRMIWPRGLFKVSTFAGFGGFRGAWDAVGAGYEMPRPVEIELPEGLTNYGIYFHNNIFGGLNDQFTLNGPFVGMVDSPNLPLCGITFFDR